MNTNWKKLVQQANAETFRLPEGWTAREKVAEQLGCSVERVGDAMRPLIASKPPRAEARAFEVWDSGLERRVRVMAYREIIAQRTTAPMTNRAKTIAELRGQGLSFSEIAQKLGCSKTNVQRIAKRRGIK